MSRSRTSTRTERLDIVTASADVVRVYLQNVNGSFATSRVGTDGPVSAIGLGDVNRDGDTDKNEGASAAGSFSRRVG